MLRVKATAYGAELYVYGTIEEGFDVDVIDALKRLKGKSITLRINSPGGLVDVALAAYSALRRHDGPVVTIVDSLAASAGSLLALVGSSRLTEPTGRWMIHQANVGLNGNATQLRKAAGVLDQYDDALAKLYSRVMKPGTNIAALMAAETWFNAEQAVAIGLATGITEAIRRPAANQARWSNASPQTLRVCKPWAM